ncbi:MAG: S8 family serine peptidase [Candidatus Thiodiazotropha sp. (ex Ustalcina ferruginea)]|nr:S8 family serine peptidase [Candidatus Thiodiazotropha sp. (ex Ustalcina ferruginea)]
MPKRLIIAAIWGIVFYIPTLYGAAALTAEVEKLVTQANRTSHIPVIVKFIKLIDINQFCDIFRKQHQYEPDTHTKPLKQKKLFRKRLLRGLREQIEQPRAVLGKTLRKHGVKTRLKSLWSINAIALDLPTHLADEIAALPEVDRITVDLRLTMSTEEVESISAEPLWNLNNVNTQQLWQQGITGEGVVVAIMDSGADLNHPDLSEKWRGGINSWFDPFEEHELPVDQVGHGTQALGLILAGDESGYQIGMAPEAKWIAARIFDDANQTTLSAIHEAFQWLLDPDGDPLTDDAPDLVNNSWGFATTINQCYQEYSDDIQLLREAGIGVIFAAGNFAPLDESSISPANNPGALSVGSVDQFNAIELLSSRGPGACDGGVFPKLVAPGGQVFTTDILPVAYNVVSGTSFAAPYITGAMALLKSAFPEATLSQIETAMYDSATDLGEPGADDHFGYGLLNVAAAYERLLASFGSSDSTLLAFSEPSYSIDEETKRLVITVRRLGGSAGEVSVDYHTSDGDARERRDYSGTSDTLTFADGETLRSFEVPILDDQLDEENESFYLTLSNPRGSVSLGNQTEVEVTILDDDGIGTFSFDAISYAVNESRREAFVNVLRTGATSGTAEIEYRIVSDTATADVDYIAGDGKIHFSHGESEKQIHIELVDDKDFEGNERFQLLLSNSDDDAEIGEPASTTVTILDDDPDSRIASIHFDAVSYDISENSSVVTIEVVRTGNTEGIVSIEYTTLDGSARHDREYLESSGKLTFLPGSTRQSLTVKIINDGVYKKESSFSLQLSNASDGAVVSQPSAAIVRILDDDALPFVSFHTATSPSWSNQSGSATGSVSHGGGSAEADNTSNAPSGLKVFDLTLRDYAPGKTYSAGDSQTPEDNLNSELQLESEQETGINQSTSACGQNSGSEGGKSPEACTETQDKNNSQSESRTDTSSLRTGVEALNDETGEIPKPVPAESE